VTALANRPGDPNNLCQILDARGITEKEMATAAGMAQGSVNRLKNRKHAPSVRGAWRIVVGLRKLTGDPIAFEAVWPIPGGIRGNS